MNFLTHGQIVNKLEKAKVIRPYVPLFGSSRVSALLHILSRKKSVRRNNGLYKIGHGDKSVIWYWEFDMEKRYFHQFRTIDYAAAQEFYLANKSTMWKGNSEREDIDRRATGQKNNANTSIEALHGSENGAWYVYILLSIVLSVIFAFGMRILNYNVN